MNNARKTVNVYLYNFIAANMAGWTFSSGDEVNPVVTLPVVAVEWLDGDRQSPMIAEGRMRLVQIDVMTNFQDTDGAENACLAILAVFNLHLGSQPMSTIPKQSWAIVAGSPSGTPIGTNITLRKQADKGWNRIDPPQQQIRRYSITLEAHYLPG